jgi:hypothetical protein
MERRMKISPARAKPVSRHLTLADAVEIWLRRAQGEAQHVLAAAYGVNPGRIAEVLSGKRFPEAQVIAEQQKIA